MKTKAYNSSDITLPFTAISLPKTSFCVVTGRPGMGITSYLKEIIQQNPSKCLAFFPCQMEDSSFMSENPMVHFEYAQLWDIETLKAGLALTIERKQPEYIIIDGIERLVGLSSGKNWKKQTTEVLQTVHWMCKERRLTLIISVHLYSSVDERGGDRYPELQDLKNPFLEIFPDVVLGIYQASVYGIITDVSGNDPGDIAKLFALKNSFGPLRVYDCRVDDENAPFLSKI
jgi:hypothetical protein